MSSDDADAGGPPGTADATRDGSQRSAGDILGEDRSKRYIRYNVGVFVAIGVGFAVAFLLLDAFASGGGGGTAGTGSGSNTAGGTLVLVGALFAFLFSPVVSALTGTVTALRLDDTEKAVATVAGVGSFVGFLGFLFLLILIASMVGPDGASDVFTEDLLAMIGWGVGVAAAGGGTAYVTERFA